MTASNKDIGYFYDVQDEGNIYDHSKILPSLMTAKSGTAQSRIGDRQQEYIPPYVKSLSRCPTCGGKVQLPCVLCEPEKYA